MNDSLIINKLYFFKALIIQHTLPNFMLLVHSQHNFLENELL